MVGRVPGKGADGVHRAAQRKELSWWVQVLRERFGEEVRFDK